MKLSKSDLLLLYMAIEEVLNNDDIQLKSNLTYEGKEKLSELLGTIVSKNLPVDKVAATEINLNKIIKTYLE